MPDVETIMRCVSRDEEDRAYLQAAFDELWDECCGRYAGLGNTHRVRARETKREIHPALVAGPSRLDASR